MASFPKAVYVTLFRRIASIIRPSPGKTQPKIYKPKHYKKHSYTLPIVLATSFVILVSLLAMPCYNYPYHVKCHLAYLSYLSPYPTFKTKLHDGTTFMSSEFHLSIVYVAHTSFLFVTSFMCLYIATFSITCFVILGCKCKSSSKCGCFI